MLSGNVTDFSLIHTSLSGSAAVTTEWAVPWRPHALLTLHLDIEAATKDYRQIQYFPPLPATPDIDFGHGPPTSHKPMNPTSTAMGRLDIPHRAVPPTRASMISARPRSQPTSCHQATGCTKVRRHLEERQGCILGAATGPLQSCTEATSQPRRLHGCHQGPPTWGRFLDTCHHWHQYRDPHAADLLQHTIQHQLQEAQQVANEEGRGKLKVSKDSFASKAVKSQEEAI